MEESGGLSRPRFVIVPPTGSDSMHSRGDSLQQSLYIHSGASSNGQYWGKFARQGRPTTVSLVLEYIRRAGVPILTPMEVRSWIKENYGLDLDRRRIHDAFKKLEKMGVLQRIKRGWYRVVDLARALAELARRRKDSSIATESDCCRAATRTGAGCGSCGGRGGVAGSQRVGGSGLVVSFDGCYVVVRWHRRVGRAASGDPVRVLLDLVGALSFLRGVFEDALREAKGLVRRLGVSVYAVRRVVGRAQRLLRWLRRRGRVVVGVHGCEGRRCGKKGRFYPFEEYVRLVTGNPHPEVWFKEVGFDYVVCLDGGVDAGGDGLAGEVGELVSELYDMLGSGSVYVPLHGRGARKHRGYGAS